MDKVTILMLRQKFEHISSSEGLKPVARVVNVFNLCAGVILAYSIVLLYCGSKLGWW